jgi:hypothetical protein
VFANAVIDFLRTVPAEECRFSLRTICNRITRDLRRRQRRPLKPLGFRCDGRTAFRASPFRLTP